MRISVKLFMRREIINDISDTCGMKPCRCVQVTDCLLICNTFKKYWQDKKRSYVLKNVK